MAANLTRVDLGSSAGIGANRYKLASDGANLVVMKCTRNISQATVVVTPSEEKYLKAASYGQSSNYSYNIYSNSNDIPTLSDRLKNIRAAATDSQWADGHAMLFNYCARSYCPCHLRYGSDVNPNNNMTAIYNKMEYGTSWSALRFNLYGFPFKASNLTAATIHNAWWRVWNPSNIQQFKEPGTFINDPRCFPTVYDSASLLCYHFDNALCAPKQCIESGYGQIDVPGIANCGASNNSVPPGTITIDPFGLSSSDRSGYVVWLCAKAYAKNSIAEEYYQDVEITGNQLAALKSAIQSGRGGFWVHFGYLLGHFMPSASQGYFAPFSTLCTNVSRIELVLKFSMNRFNYS